MFYGRISPEQTPEMRLRTRIVALGMAVVCFGVLACRLAYLQLLDSGWYAAKAADQQLRDTVIPAARGKIYSKDGTLLADSATCWTIRAEPRALADQLVEPASRALSELLELDYEEVLEKLSQRTSNDALLKYRVDKETADAVRDWAAENQAQGILIIQDTRRVYPEGDFLGSVLGFTNVDNAGMAGIELEYNWDLTGINGRVLTAKNAWGYAMPQDYDVAVQPVEGNSLVLTIDAHIQHYLEKSLEAAVEEHNVGARAVGIVMEVDTGAILAMSTTPDFDPNQPRVIVDEETRALVDSLTGEERSAALQQAQQYQWRNKAISDLYEPGSVFKLITASAALDSGAITPSDTYYCGKAYNVAGTQFHCANHKSHGLQNLETALQNSCNQSFIQIGQRLGKEAFTEYFAAFGLREGSGIDLPGEIRRSEYYTADRMGPVELASCSFGQSSKISYLQMITAVSAVVNGGRLMQPYLVQEIRDVNGNLLRETEPVVKNQVIRPETSDLMREMMEAVVLEGGGKNAYVDGYRIGGKSGTSQKLDSEDEKARIASFVGVAPMDDPQIAVLICLDEPHSWSTAGGSLSAPVVADVLEESLAYLGYLPQEAEDQTSTE